MLGFFEGGVLRHDEPPDQPADEPRFVPVIEVIFIRQPHGAVFGVQLPQQLYHGTPVAQHPGACALVGGNAGADLIPRNAAVIADYWDVFHGKEPRGEILGQQDAARHLFQRLYEQFPLIHEPSAADAVIIEQHIALGGLGVIRAGAVGRAVKRRVAGALDRCAVPVFVAGQAAKGDPRGIAAQDFQQPRHRVGVVEIVPRRDGEHPFPGCLLCAVQNVFDRAAVGGELDKFCAGKAVFCKNLARQREEVLIGAVIRHDQFKITAALPQQRRQRPPQLALVGAVLDQEDG